MNLGFRIQMQRNSPFTRMLDALRMRIDHTIDQRKSELEAEREFQQMTPPSLHTPPPKRTIPL